MKIKKIFIVFLSSIFIFLLDLKNVFAATNTNVEWPSTPMGTSLPEGLVGVTLAQITQYFYEWGITLGGLFCFVSLVIAGVQYLTSAGNPSGISASKNRIKASLMGLLLLLSTFLILNTINPGILNLDFNDGSMSGQLSDSIFINYEIEGDCAYAKLFVSDTDWKNSGSWGKDSEKNTKLVEVGKAVNTTDFGWILEKASVVSPIIGAGGALIDSNQYKAVRFFSEPRIKATVTIFNKSSPPISEIIINEKFSNLMKTSKTCTTTLKEAIKEEEDKLKSVEGSNPISADDIKGMIAKESVCVFSEAELNEMVLSLGLIKDTDDNYYIQSMGSECKMYVYKEASCASIYSLWDGVANITFPTNSIPDLIGFNLSEIKCVALVNN